MIGNKITEARKRLNISQAQLAKLLFISSQAVGKWERGESMPDIITLNHLAEILGVDLNYFSESFQVEPAKMVTAESVTESAVKLNPTLDQPLASGKQKKHLNWNMSRGNWLEADFSGLKNLHEKFSSSNMQRCKFIGSDLSGLILSSNNIDRCDFSGSNLSSSHIKSSNLANNIFKDCSLTETEISGSYITGCDFSGADLSGAIFKYGGFQNNQMINTVLNRTTFNAMQLADVVFTGTMEDCFFENCAFKKVTFQNSILINTFFKNKNLKRIRFIDCQADRMTYEFLKNGKADLNGISLMAV